MDTNTKKSLKDIERFFQRESMYNVMKSTLSLLLLGRDVNFKLNIGGGSYTDSETLVVGLPEPLFSATYEEMYIAILALLGHESQHILSSNFDEFQRYNEEETQKLINKGVHEKFASELVHAIGNSIEDGRIERILVNEYPGYINKIQFLNMYFWNLGNITKETNELQGLISSILSLSTLGIYPKGYEVLKGTKLDKQIIKVKPLVLKGTQARTCKNCLGICRQILSILTPYILELYEEVKDKYEIMDKIMEMLEEINDRNNFNSSEETVKNDNQSHSSHISFSSKKEDSKDTDEDMEENQSQGQSQSQNQNQSQSQSQSQSQGQNEDKNKDEAEIEDGNGNENGDEDKDGDEGKSKDKDGDEGDENKSKDGNSNDNDNNKKNTDENNKDSINNKKNDNNNNSSNNDDSINNEPNQLSDGLNTLGNPEETEAFSEEEIIKRIQEITKELNDEVQDAFMQANKSKKKNSEEDTTKNIQPLTAEELKELQSRGFGFTEHPNDFPLDHKLPPEIIKPAKKFRKEVEKIFKNKSSVNVRGQRKGVLDVENLYRVGFGDYNIFTIEGNKSQSDYVAYILQDGSGSMRGDKETSSAFALSIIEEGLRGIIPFKLVTFNASFYGGINHYVIKNWNDNLKKNYSFNYLQHNRANMGNEDGISIAIATKELLKRPERDKILIVLSDGLPANIVTTKEAIKEARKKKIHVVGIMFGSKGFREETLPTYKEMYQKNIIATSPAQIPNKLTSVLKKILVR